MSRKARASAHMPLFTDSRWTFPLLQRTLEECEQIGKDELKLDLYSNQIEIVSSEQMLDAYASIGMPIMYQHWSWGMSFAHNQALYRKGHQGLAYELVLNSSPCISYCMEDNSMTMQALVIAHAAVGHNSFFKMNEFFKQWTDADGIIDYLVFAKNYVTECENRYGFAAVERVLDSCHALMSHGIDRYTKPSKLSAEVEKKRLNFLEDEEQRSINELWKTLPKKVGEIPESESEKLFAQRRKLLKLPEENLLYFIEKKSPTLKSWERELVRIVRKISQYFYPQGETKVMNEGWASTVHYYIINRLHDKGLISDGSFLEFLRSHTSVLHQLSFESPSFSGINPYALGFAIFEDIKRICENPTSEDKEWFPHLAGRNWLEEWHFAMVNFRDESFIRQYLSPHLIRKWHLFTIHDDASKNFLEVENIHNERGYKKVRAAMANQYSSAYRTPDIQVWDVNLEANRYLQLRHEVHSGRPLDKDAGEVMKHVLRLWGYGVILESFDSETGRLVNTHKVEAT